MTFFVLSLILWMPYFLQGTAKSVEIPYSEFETLLSEKKVDQLVVTDQFIRGQFKEPRKDSKTEFITVRVPPDLAKSLAESGVTYTKALESTFFKDLLSWTLPALIFIGFWILLGRYMASKGGFGAGMMSVGKSKAKLYMETDTQTTFADVAGVDEALDELREVVEFLKKPEDYSRLGARMPKGILLVGPPGTGKTLIAKAVAGEARVPFFSISGSEFVELFVGVGAARVRDLFEQARQKAPCIIFIDELDALGKARTPQIGSGGHDEKEQTLNQLLAELDGFDTKAGVILLAATNRPEMLDPALLRAGRFDRQVLVDRPDKKGREAILKVHIKKIKYESSIEIDEIAGLTSGFTGADMANLVNEAALIATRRKSEIVEKNDFVVAIERIVAGLEKRSRILNEKERRTVAYHEMGHAIVAAALPGCDRPQKISIIPRGFGALGYTIQRPTEDRYLMTREELSNKMAVLLGGRVAESLVFHEISTGAADDLVKVTNIAEAIVTKYGMSPMVGPIVFEQQISPFLEGPYQNIERHIRSEATAKLIDSEIKNLVEDAQKKTKHTLMANRHILEEGAKLLLEKETLTDVEFKPLFEKIVMTPEPHPERDTWVDLPI
ncbi:ATP-dependent zinc metalloprotease FtsH [Bdellovibrio sp. HCB337]|uniref:ATP-dependent zinc metalloprotease FtsH n=1 Tax=Bdellovibrio sp. HCB337 TaxID=3394358 RepID=UPI0039A56E73